MKSYDCWKSRLSGFMTRLGELKIKSRVIFGILPHSPPHTHTHPPLDLAILKMLTLDLWTKNQKSQSPLSRVILYCKPALFLRLSLNGWCPVSRSEIYINPNYTVKSWSIRFYNFKKRHLFHEKNALFKLAVPEFFRVSNYPAKWASIFLFFHTVGMITPFSTGRTLIQAIDSKLIFFLDISKGIKLES